MTRRFVSTTDRQWVMGCDECPHFVGPRASQGDLPLEEFAEAGWFVARVFGDACPECVERLGGMDHLIFSREPSDVMGVNR